MSLEVKKNNDRYPQCNFCGSKVDIYSIGADGKFIVVSICKKCINEVFENVNPYEMWDLSVKIDDNTAFGSSNKNHRKHRVYVDGLTYNKALGLRNLFQNLLNTT